MLQGYENLEVSYSLQELWISVLIVFYCKKKASLMSAKMYQPMSIKTST